MNVELQKLDNKIHFVTTKQSLRTIAASHEGERQRGLRHRSYRRGTGICGCMGSGTGTNLKVGAPIRRKAPEKKIFLVVPLHFIGSKSTISRFGERFCDGQYSLVSFFVCCSATQGAPRAQPFVKVGARAPVPHGVGATVYRVSLLPLAIQTQVDRSQVLLVSKSDSALK